MIRFTKVEEDVAKLRKSQPIFAGFELDEASQYDVSSRVFLFP
jgi:hypothetical protein